MNKILTSALVIIGLVSLPALANEGSHKKHGHKDGHEAKMQKTCPVMGGKINKDLYVDAKGKRIYVCCKGCISKVKAEPEKYIEKLEKKGENVAKLQTKCPVMGGKINKDLYVDHEGKRIYVCCKGCISKVKADPEKYIKKIKMAGEAVPDAEKKEMKHKHHEGSHK